jgi:hypothetical protein
MEWWWWIRDPLCLLLAAVFGFTAARIEIRLDRRRAKREAKADWQVTRARRQSNEIGPSAWVLTNIGEAKAFDVLIDIKRGKVGHDDEKWDLDKSESEAFVVMANGDSKLLIWWTSHRGERCGPVSRMLFSAD